VGLYLTSYYFGGSVGASLPAALWSFAGWPACVALVLAVQLFAALLIHATWARPPARSAAALPALGEA
jgi:hypothetical protein